MTEDEGSTGYFYLRKMVAKKGPDTKISLRDPNHINNPNHIINQEMMSSLGVENLRPK